MKLTDKSAGTATTSFTNFDIYKLKAMTPLFANINCIPAKFVYQQQIYEIQM